MKKEKKKIIRSELTHKQEISLTHPGPSNEVIERIRSNLESIERSGIEGKMKKKDAMRAIADFTGITEIQVEKALDAYIRIIEKCLKERRQVIISDFGTFTTELVVRFGKPKPKVIAGVRFKAAEKLLKSLQAG